MFQWLEKSHLSRLRKKYPCPDCRDGWVPCEEVVRGVNRSLCMTCKGTGVDIKAAKIITSTQRNEISVKARYSFYLTEKNFKKEKLDGTQKLDS
jgi:hypothetical protein